MEQSLNEAKESFRRTHEEYERSQYYKSYKLNEFWGHENLKLMRGLIADSKNSLDAIHGVQRSFLFSVNVPDQIREDAVDWLLADQLANGFDIFSLPDTIQESAHSLDVNNVVRRGRRLNPNFLRAATISNNILKTVRFSQNPTIIELGAGLGTVATVLKNRIPGVTYFIVDLPETLFFSQQFLRLNFPNDRHLYLESASTLPSAEDCRKYDVVFVPTKLAGSLKGREFDLFLNTASLGEMDNSVIRHWMDFVQNQIQAKHIYTLNRFLNVYIPHLQDWRLNENLCSMTYDNKWNILNWELEPSFTRCPYVDTMVARSVEIIARREPPIHDAETLLKQVQREDWVNLAKHVSPEMSVRGNQLLPDLTMRGALFKLWNSIRLAPSAENLLLMLKYLELLLRGPYWEFEEADAYEQMFLNHPDSAGKFPDEVRTIREKREMRAKQFPSIVPTLWQKENRTADYHEAPVLLGDFKYFNIVFYRRQLIGIKQELGPVDFSRPDVFQFLESQTKFVIFANSYNELRLKILEASQTPRWRRYWGHDA